MKPRPRHRRRRTYGVIAGLAAGALAVAGTLAGLQWATPGPASADEYTVSQNLSRDGWDNTESYLSPAAVSGKSFGQIFDTPVNGQVYGQPLSVGSNVLVATENDYVYSINRNSGAVNWSTQLGTPWDATTGLQAATGFACGSRVPIEPYLGVTSSPVYDPSTGTMYVTGMISGPAGDDADISTATPQYVLFALNEATGAINWQQPIQGSPTDDTSLTFSAALQLQRTGLLLLNGAVYMGFGADCADLNAKEGHAYNGYIAGVSTSGSTHAVTLWSDQSNLAAGTGSYGGIWQGGGGLVSDGTNIYFSTGNGTGPPLGTTDSASSIASVVHFGQSMMKLSVTGSPGQSGWSLTPTDFFSPGNADTMASFDHDFGSGGPVLLPFTTSAYPKGLFFTADKEAYSYLISAASMGGRSSDSSATGSTAVWTGQPSFVENPPSASATIPSVGHGLWGHVAAIAGTVTSGSTTTPADYIYYEGSGWSQYAQMYAFKFDGSNPAAPTLKNVAETSLPAPAGLKAGFGFSSGSPVVTSNGSAMSSAVVWEVYAPNSTGMVAATSTTPAVTGQLMAFAALPDTKTVQADGESTLTQLFSAPIGEAAEFTVPATSGSRVYVAARNDGSAATTSGTCATNFESATYTSSDSACVGQVYEFGIKAGVLTASATSVNLGHVALGQSATKAVTLTNTGDAPLTITGFTAPAVPFGTPAPLAAGQKIAAGASVSLPITFTPQAKGTITGKYTITESDGFTSRTVAISVGGVGAPVTTGTAWVPSPGGGWTLNGNTLMTGNTLQLNSAAVNQVGSAVFYQPVPSNGLHAKFTVRMNGGSGGDGLTFSLLNPASATTARGYGGSQLGFGGLNGVAVVLGTRQDAGFPSANFIGIATSTAGGHLVLRASTTKVPNLRSGFPVITVAVAGTRVSVGVGGKTYLTATVPVPSMVMPAFTAANGAHGDVHDVGSEAITTTVGTLPQPGGGWSYNGNAGMSGSDSVLTAPVASQRGSVVYAHPVATTAFSATFDAQLGGGSGGEGETLALLQPGSATSLGANGTGLGFAGLSGLAVVLGTQQLAGAPSDDFVGIETATAGGTPTWAATTDLSSLASPINLRSGTHMVTVTVASGTVTVTIDGKVVLTQATTVPSTAYVAFTASTGTVTDRHYVRNAAISAG